MGLKIWSSAANCPLRSCQALARATGGLRASIGTRSHSGFFNTLRRGIGAQCQREDPRVALLTPGRFSQSYPEQAILARQLGFSLVEGRDLTVRDGRLFARTIAGPKRIDALWRWITTRDLDPLHFDSRSQIGVPGLITAAEHGRVLTNWPGGGVVESRAMPAFLPRLDLFSCTLSCHRLGSSKQHSSPHSLSPFFSARPHLML